MSAYVCNSTHIALLACKAASWTKTWGNAQKIAEVLATQNLRSVEARYPDTEGKAAYEFLRIENDAFVHECVEKTYDANIEYHHLPMPRIFGMAHCLQYQSCESDDFKTTDAAAILNFVAWKAAQAHFDAQKLETGWEFDPSEIKTNNIIRII